MVFFLTAWRVIESTTHTLSHRDTALSLSQIELRLQMMRHSLRPSLLPQWYGLPAKTAISAEIVPKRCLLATLFTSPTSGLSPRSRLISFHAGDPPHLHDKQPLQGQHGRRHQGHHRPISAPRRRRDVSCKGLCMFLH